MMPTHQIYRWRKHLILEHGWTAGDPRTTAEPDAMVSHHEDDHAQRELSHSHPTLMRHASSPRKEPA